MKSLRNARDLTKTALLLLVALLVNPWFVEGQVCPAGLFSATGNAPCSFCPVGAAQPLPGQTACVACVAGSYQDAIGSTTCISCGPGTANPDTGSSSSSACSLCAAGTFSNAAAAACTPCAVGTFNTGSGSATCADCSAGTYQSATGQTGCLTCPTGTYQNEPAAAACTACSPGTFNASTGSSSASACQSCAAGTFQAASGAASCSACGVGTVQPSAGQTACVACVAGTYTFTTGGATCTRCTSRSSKVMLTLKALNRTGRTNGRLVGGYSVSGSKVAGIRPDLHGLKLVLENGAGERIFTALLPGTIGWRSNGAKTVYRFTDTAAEAGVSGASVRLKKVGKRATIILAVSLKKTTIVLPKGALPLSLNVGFGADGVAPCSRRRLSAKNCVFSAGNTQMVCQP